MDKSELIIYNDRFRAGEFAFVCLSLRSEISCYRRTFLLNDFVPYKLYGKFTNNE